MSAATAQPMDFEPFPQQQQQQHATNGTVTKLPPPSFAHVNTGVYSGHPGLQAFLTLGLPPNAPLSAIKSRYKKLALACHPDKVNGTPEEQQEAHDKFAKISAAYELLVHAYSKYNGGKSSGTHYPVFFGTPDSLAAHETRERDPYELFRNTFGSNNNTTDITNNLPHRAPENCIIPGDSSCLFKVWPNEKESAAPPLCLTNEAHPENPVVVPETTTEPMDMDTTPSSIEEVPHMKRTLETYQDMEDEMPRRKRQRV